MMKRLLLIALLLTLGATPILAQSPVVTSFSGGSPFGIFYGDSTGDVVGFRFTADAAITVTDLGVYNDALGDGVLDSAHMVGLWRNSDMSLLTSTSVDSSGTLIGDFYYAPTTPATLVAGDEYTLGALYTADDGDSYISSPGSVTTDMISATNGVFPDAGDLGFIYPGSDSTNLARFGPNALFVPEPASCLMILVGLAFVGRLRR